MALGPFSHVTLHQQLYQGVFYNMQLAVKHRYVYNVMVDSYTHSYTHSYISCFVKLDIMCLPINFETEVGL